MFKKVLLSSSVFFGLLLFVMAEECFADASAYFEQATSYYEAGEYGKARELYQYVLDNWPEDANYAIWSQTLVALSNIDVGQMEAADAAIDKLRTEFSDNEHIAEVVHHIAYHYLTLKEYEKAKQLYQYVLDHWPDDDSCAIWSQTGVAMSSISLGDTEAADAAGAKLLNKFSDNRHIAEEVHHLAWHCRYQAGDHQRAIQFYQYVLDRWPGDHKYAIWSQSGLALSYIDLGNTEGAQAAVDKLLTDFSGNEHLPEEVHHIAYHYRTLKEHEKAKQFYQYILDHWPGDDKYAIWSQSGVALSYIDLGNTEAAQAAVDKLLTDFSGNDRIAEQVHNIAYHYRELKKYEKAKQLYQYVLDHWPDSNPYAMWSQTGVGVSNAALGDDPNAQLVIDSLITDFHDHPDLFGAISRIEEGYYIKILSAEPPISEDYYRNPIKLWEKVMSKFPDFFYDDPDLYYFIADCYRHLDEYEKAIEYCQKTINSWPDYHYAWYTQFLIGNCYEWLRYSGRLPKSKANQLIEQAYTAVIEKYPNCSLAKEARLRLRQLNFEGVK